MHSGWLLDIDKWPGPDRARWGITRDIVVPSPDSHFACVLYSCTELRLGCEAGLLTLVEGPPDSPTVVFQPPSFTCFDFSPRPSAAWLGAGRFAVVTAYLYRVGRNRVELLALTFLDTVRREFAHYEIPLEHAGRWHVDADDDWILTDGSTTPHRIDVRRLATTLCWRPWASRRADFLGG
jgi:hypothetical protein